MSRPKPRRPDKKSTSGQSSSQNRGRAHSKNKGKPSFKGDIKTDKLNQLPEIYKKIIVFSLLAYLSVALLWVLNAPEQVVWVLILIPIPWIFVHLFPLEERYTKIAEKLIFVFAAAVLVIVLGFSHQSIIDLDNNPKIELLKQLIDKLLR
jgi:hypothetical protein